MHSIQIHRVISLIITTFYRMGFWHKGDKPTSKEIRIKLFYSIYYLLYSVSLSAGVMRIENGDAAIFLIEILISSVIFAVKFWLLIWKQNQILHLLNRVCVFSIRNDDDHNRFSDKLGGFIKFWFLFVVAAALAGFLSTILLSVIGNEKTLFLEIGFPLDYKKSALAFWIAMVFLVTEVFLSILVIVFTTVIWYLLFICSLRYEVLGSELKNMGRISEEGDTKMTERQMHNTFIADLNTSIDTHIHLRNLTTEMETFFSHIIIFQFGTSGLCICGSIYCLAFDIGDNLLERLMYLFVVFFYISEIFMITYFGNEIMLGSNRLSYNLFESDWFNQPQSTKKCIIIFGEYLKQPQVLLIGKLYPLTLETFSRILNSAYSMFNILKNFRH